MAEACAKEGASIINDVSAGEIDPDIVDVCTKYNLPYIAMHMKGTPQTMQQQATYENVVIEVMDYFRKKIQRFKDRGLQELILDVGFGFAKTTEHNYQLLNKLEAFQSFKKPLLVGLSRKSMIYKPLKSDALHALNGTTALHMVALQKGAAILRVHDVREAVECINLFKMLEKNKIPDSPDYLAPSA